MGAVMNSEVTKADVTTVMWLKIGFIHGIVLGAIIGLIIGLLV
jgi:F0F1-type ATP synthase assembly protein I